ncbi:MAG: hypothetical protein NVS3B14_08520 [Ktedonobacteraceae bacterium]
MIHTDQTVYTEQPVIFYPAPAARRRIRLLASLLIGLSLNAAAAFAYLAILLWPTYTHYFTPYLKWQDALLATLCYCSFILLVAAIVVARFLLALRIGQRHGILILQTDRAHTAHPTITVRDLSPKNLASIYWSLGATLTCFLAALIGLAPNILIGWTLHLTQPALTILATAIAVTLSLLGLIITIVSASFVLIGLVGTLSLTRSLGAPHVYPFTAQTTLRVDGLHPPILSLTYPDHPETLFDLNLLHSRDQQQLLQLLQQHWLYPHPQLSAQPALDQHIEAALEEARRIFTSSQNCAKNT